METNDFAGNQIIYVSNEGPVKDIQSAIKLASQHAIIRVKNGFYKGFVVTKQGLTIEAMSGHDNVVILVDKGDAILVNCEMEGATTIKNLKIAHTVSKTDLNINKLMNILFKNNKAVKKKQSMYMSLTAKKYTSSLSQVCLLRVVSGEVTVSHCHFSFKIMSKSLEMLTPAIVGEQNTKIKLTSCEIIGHKIYQTVGIICQKASLYMNDCKIYSNLNGGISVLIGLINRRRKQTRNS
jgi:hypothetical protein